MCTRVHLQGNGPLEPDPVNMGYIFCGQNPVAIDFVCARFMGFDPLKIPMMKNSFRIDKYKICDYKYKDIKLQVDGKEYFIDLLPKKYIHKFEPHFGWKGFIEFRNEYK